MLPELLPDMTLYSLCASAHRLSDRSCASETSLALFGNARAGLLQDFPYAIGAFCANTRGLYGSPSDIVLRTTTLPYFLRFRPSTVAAEMTEILAGQAAPQFKFSLGLQASPIGAKFPLRACEQCADEDIREYGIAYWHRRHQLPGVWACQKHTAPLRHSSFRIDRRRGSCYIMPSDAGVLAASSVTGLPDAGLGMLARLAALSADLLDTPLPLEYQPERLRNTYLHGLKAQGLLTRQGRVRVQELIKYLRIHFSPIAGLPPFDWLLSNRHIESFARLVRRRRSDVHTTYHAMMIDALFGGLLPFAKVYEWEAAILPTLECDSSEPRIAASAICRDPRVAAVIARAKNEVRSLSSICKESGVDYQTVLRQSAAEGSLLVARRPKVLTAELRASVVAALMQGIPQRHIAAGHGLSRSTVDRICVEMPNLHAEWQRARFLRRRDIERKRMQSFLGDNPGIGRAEARAIGDNGYSWLIRHDADWLRSTVAPKVPIRSKPQRRRERVHWQARDAECLVALEKLASGVSFVQGDRRTTGALMRKLPRLSFAPRLERLPKSKAYATRLVDGLDAPAGRSSADQH